MNRLKTLRIAMILTIVWATPALSAAQITSVTFCPDVSADLAPLRPCTDFTADAPALHAVVTLTEAKPDSVVKAAWISVDAINVPNFQIDVAEVKLQSAGDATAHFSLSRPNNGWPLGNYKLTVSIDGIPTGAYPFAIKPAPPASPPAATDQLQKSLHALDAAHEAGILTEQEYQTKKKELLARARTAETAVDKQTQEKLKALDAALQAGILTQEEYNAKKNALLHPPTAPTPPVKTPAPVTPQPQPKSGQTYRHAAGLSFWYPTGWTVTGQDELLQLTPPQAAVSPEGPLELYFFAVEDVSGQNIQRPDDPQVVAYLDQQVKSLSPLLNRTGSASPVRAALGPGARLDWQATSPDGKNILARTFVALSQNKAAMLVAMGLREALVKRAADLHDIFTTLTWGAPQPPLLKPAATVAAPPAPPVAQPPAPPAPDLTTKLKVLEAAHQAGVLSDQEFAQKKTEVLKARAALEADRQKKLKALEQARQAGIIDDREFARKKAELLGEPIPSGPADAAPVKENIRHASAQKGKMYRHVIGFNFWHPGDWSVKPHDEFLQLIPPDPATSPEGPTELYFILGESLAGEAVSDPADPLIPQFLDQQIAQVAPFLQRNAGPQPVQMAHSKGVLLKWQGNNPQGKPVLAHAYVSIINQYGVALLSLGLETPLQKREKQIRQIFASFGFGKGQLDPQLVGKWNFLRTGSLTNWSPFETHYTRAQLVSESTALLEFHPDGSWIRTDNSLMIAGAGGLWIESNEKKVDRGRWYAGNKELFLISSDNSWEDYEYTMRQTQQGLQLVLISGKTAELWLKAP